MRECSNCFWYENEHTCQFNTLCNRTFNKTGEYKYHIYSYEAKRLLCDILLDMNRMYNRNETVNNDIVNVIRCKDCKYVWKHENGCYECGYGFCEVKENFYCADGERK